MKHIPHAHGRGIRQEDKAQVGRRLVVMQTVLPGSVANESVVLAAQLADHVPQTEDGTEYELGVILGAGSCLEGGCCGLGPIGGDWAGTAGVGDGRGELRRGKPCFGVDALGCECQWCLLWTRWKGSVGSVPTVPVKDVKRVDHHDGQCTTSPRV